MMGKNKPLGLQKNREEKETCPRKCAAPAIQAV
jgi:hypothetical protein